jgi:hypothetical protein
MRLWQPKIISLCLSVDSYVSVDSFSVDISLSTFADKTYLYLVALLIALSCVARNFQAYSVHV